MYNIWDAESSMVHESNFRWGDSDCPNNNSPVTDNLEECFKRWEKLPPLQREYLNFSKYYNERLRAEHPRWTPKQVSVILNLLWKKRKQD